jgi:hypothetical protein
MTAAAATRAGTASAASGTTLTSLVDNDLTSVELRTVQLGHGGLALFRRCELHEPESTRTAAHAVDHYSHRRHVSKSLELLAETVLGRRIGQIADKKSHTNFSFYFFSIASSGP